MLFKTQHWVAIGRGMAVALLMLTTAAAATAQTTPPDQGSTLYDRSPLQWIQRVSENEPPIILQNSPHIRFHELYQGNKGIELRDVIESKDGSVARLLAKNGRPLTVDENAAERTRLQHLLDYPNDYYKHHKDDGSDNHRAVQMIYEMPQAMIYTYAAVQTPTSGHVTPQVVIDYHPNPAYHPPDMQSQALQGISGRIWVDAANGRIVRMHADVHKDIDFGWGLVARIYHGGSLDFEQTDAGPRWVFSRLDEQFNVRAFLFRTVRVNTHIQSSGYKPVEPMRFQDAIRLLLDETIPAQCPCH